MIQNIQKKIKFLWNTVYTAFSNSTYILRNDVFFLKRDLWLTNLLKKKKREKEKKILLEYALFQP